MFPVTETESAETAHTHATPISEAKLAANRRNAQLSTGPRSEAGKQRARLNAARHHLTGHVIMAPDEELEALEVFCRDFVTTYAPTHLEERLIVRAIAEDYWRLSRARAVEANWFALDLATRPDDPMAGGHHQIEHAIHMAKTFRERPSDFTLLTLYEQRAYRRLDRNLRKLELAREQHAKRRAKALRDSVHLERIYSVLGRPFDPEAEGRANGGFVFASVEISAAREREQLLNIKTDDDLSRFLQNRLGVKQAA